MAIQRIGRIIAIVMVALTPILILGQPTRAATASGMYSLIDLGSLPNNMHGFAEVPAVVNALNAEGWVVGLSGGHGFIYTGGPQQRIGPLTVLSPYGGWSLSSATNINATGQILVTVASYSRHTLLSCDSYLYNGPGGEGVPIGDATGNECIEANAINEAGQIVGSIGYARMPTHAFLYDAGLMRDIGTLGGVESRATGINDAGQVAGWADTGSGSRHAFLWQAGGITDLGTLGGWFSEATAVNTAGQIVGWADTGADTRHAFLSQNGGMADLGTLGGPESRAYGINDAGQVVGQAQPGDNSWHAFLYKNGTIHDLNDVLPPASGWVLVNATDVNQAGQITGEGLLDGERHAFLLTPRDQSATLDISTSSGGLAVISPQGPSYTSGTPITLTASPQPGYTLTGWSINGVFAGWPGMLTLTAANRRVVAATFTPRPAFSDVTTGTTGATEPIAQLATRDIVKGYQPEVCAARGLAVPCFGPTDTILRAQLAALIARAMPATPADSPGIGPQTWALEDHGNFFPDQGQIDSDLWRNVGTLNFYNVARGYQDGTYGPTDPVLNVQVVSLITRAMVNAGYWQRQADDDTIYPNVASDSGHRQDLVTYVHYAGLVRGTASATGPFTGWDVPASRAWVSFVLWQALDSYWGTDRTP